MSQVSDSDTSSIGSSDLQEGLDFWAPSTYFWALEGWEKFCLSAVSQMRAACMWPTQLHPTAGANNGFNIQVLWKCTEEFGNCSIKQTNYDSIKNSPACTALIKFDFVPHRTVFGLCEE